MPPPVGGDDPNMIIGVPPVGGNPTPSPGPIINDPNTQPGVPIIIDENSTVPIVMSLPNNTIANIPIGIVFIGDSANVNGNTPAPVKDDGVVSAQGAPEGTLAPTGTRNGATQTVGGITFQTANSEQATSENSQATNANTQ